MEDYLLTLLCIALLAGYCASAGHNVLDLGDSDFDNKIASLKNVLVMFYAPWCGHGQNLKPEFEKAADMMKDDDPAIQLVKVDCPGNGKHICSKFSIDGYPTLMIFRNGKLTTEYNGPRKADGIVNFMRSSVRDM